MPNRILKESICYSENVDGLTLFQEVFFYRLIVNCDDYGRMDARTKVLSSKLFPLRDVKDKEIRESLAALVAAELVTVYESEGHLYLQMNTWDRHQTIRAKKSKYPAFDSNCKQMNADEIICKQMNANVTVIQSNPIQSISISESVSEYDTRNPSPGRKESAKTDSIDFDVFWEAYPRKESKPAAKKAFDKIHPDEQLMQKIISSIRAWKESAQWKENGGQFIPYPASWLNQQKWNDVPPAPVQTSAPVQKQQKVLPAQDFQQRSYDGVQDEILTNLSKEMAIFKATGKVDM